MIEFQLGKFPLVTTPHTLNFRGSIKLQSSSTVHAYAEGQDRRQATHRGAGIPVMYMLKTTNAKPIGIGNGCDAA